MAIIVNAGNKKKTITSGQAAKVSAAGSALKNAMPATYPKSLPDRLAATKPAPIPSQERADQMGLAPVKPQPKKPAGTTKASSAKADTGPTADQKKQAANLLAIAQYNAQSVRDQFNRAAANIELSNQQNRALAATQKKQNSASTANDRFAQFLKLQSSSADVIGSAGNALQGSQAGNLAGMLRRRNNMDTSETLNTLTINQNAVMNALYEALSQNAISLNEAASLAENMLRGIESDTAAQLNTINQKLYVAPGTGKANLGASGFAAPKQVPASKPESSGYLSLPPTSSYTPATPANTGSSYFDQLMSGYGR